MSKFKVGDRVYGRTNVMNIEGACTITRIDPGHCICEYAACFDGHPRSDWWIYNDSVRPIQNKIIITTNGNTTLARLYEDKKVIKSAEAKCSPEDTFDFAVGAKLAFERLMGEKPDAEDVVDIDWDAFMSGKIAINLRTEKDVIALLSEIEQKYPGVTWRSGSKPTKFTTFFEEYKKNTLLGMAHGGGLTFCSIGGPSHTISKLPIVVYRKNPQPVETPTPKPAKLYCVKEYEAGEFLTKGKVYDVSGGNITYDDGWEAGWRGTNALGGRSVLGHYCVPLVRRRAKVGEWVYLTKEPSGNSTFPSNYHKGDIVRIASFGIMPSVASKGGVNWTGFREDEYLVLEGYKPEQDKQEFDWKAFAEGKIAVNCKTKPDALAFLRELESRYPDIRWRSGAEPSEINGWDLHKENTLYNMAYDDTLACCSLGGSIIKTSKLPVFVYQVSNKPEYKVGDSVRFIDQRGHKAHPAWYPPVGTIGKIKKINIRDMLVQWPAGSTSDDDCWWVTLERLEPCEQESEYYSGKVVCTDYRQGFTRGRTYEFKNGIVTDDDGDKRPARGQRPIKSLDDNWAKGTFIKFLGEA